MTGGTPGTEPAAAQPARALWRALVRVEPQKLAPEIALRNTMGFTCAVVLGTLFGSPSTGVVAGLGALNVCYSDGLDPYRVRARRMLLATFVVGCAVVLGAISARSDISAIAVAALWAFAAGMLVALGQTAADLGVITLVTLVVFAAKPLAPIAALETGAVAIGGGLIQTLLSTFLWPIRRYGPERRIIAEIYSELARVAKAPPPAAKAPPMTQQISDAQDALAPLARDHSIEAERNVFLLVQAERIRLSLLNMGRLQRRLSRSGGGFCATEAAGKILERASIALGLIGLRIPGGQPAESIKSAIEQLSAALVEFQKCPLPGGDPFFFALVRDTRFQAGTLRSQIRAAAFAEERTAVKPTFDFAGEPAGREPWQLRFRGYRARLLANISLDSIVFRHAVRMAVCLALGDAIGRRIGLQRTYWIPMTIAIVLKPDFTGTFARGVLRIGGTMAGLVFATLLLRYVHTGIGADILLMAAFTLALRWAGPANYGIFVTVVSGLVVLMIAVTGVAPEAVIGPRALNTAIGGALALVAYAIWPSWEKGQTRKALADMLDAYRAYTDIVLGGYRGEREPLNGIEAARMKGRRARSNAQASVDRMSGEPGVTARQAASLNTILVHSHSFVHAVMAMESRLYQSRRDPETPWMAGFAASVDRALSSLAEILRNPSVAAGRRSRLDVETPAPGTSGNELLETEADRIRTSLRSLGEELAKRDWL